MLAPSIKPLLSLGAPSDLDRAALAVYLRFENFLAEDTPFKHIRALPPGGRLHWTGAISITGSFHRPEPLDMSRGEATDRYSTLFRSAVERLAGKHNLVPLSGGCDSRHIALELARGQKRIQCISAAPLPPKSADDVEIAARVAAAIGVEHAVVEQDEDRFDAITATTVETSYCGREHAWFRCLGSHVARIAYDETMVFDGLGGDVLSAGLYLEPRSLDLFRRGRLDELALNYLCGGHTGQLPFLSDPELAPVELATERLISELERHQSAPNPVGSFFFWNRTRRIVSQQFLSFMPRARVVVPYLDADVFDLIAALPADLYLDHSFHREAMHKAHVDFSHIPFAASKARQHVDGQRSHFRRYGRRILRQLDSLPCTVVKRHYALPRILYLALTGDAGACWTADACLYLSQLENAAHPSTNHYRCYSTDSHGRTVDGMSILSADDARVLGKIGTKIGVRHRFT